MKKFTLLATLVASSLLAACGSDDHSETDIKPGTDFTAKVIDGYISNATVCADANKNNSCDSDEIIGQTDANGQIDIDSEQSQHNLIALIEAGVSSDNDKIGKINFTYELTANAGSKVITPFTTVMQQAEMSAVELAAAIGISTKLITSDYIELKNSDDEAIKVHAIARSINHLIATSSEPINQAQVLTSLPIAVGIIEDYINANGDSELDMITVTLNDGIPAITTNYKSLESFFLSADRWQTVSLNPTHTAFEGVQTVTFNAESKTVSIDAGDGTEPFTSGYLIDDTTLVTEGDARDEFFVITPEIALTITSGTGDLVVWSKNEIEYPFETTLLTASTFEEQNWHMLFDDSTTNSPDLRTATFSFGDLTDKAEGDVLITESNDTQSATYFIKPEVDNVLGVISYLQINLSDGDTPLKLVEITSSESIKLMYDLNRNSYSLMTKDDGFKEALENKIIN